MALNKSTISAEGAKALRQNAAELRRFAKDIAFPKAVSEARKEAVSLAKALVPVSTGALRASIQARGGIVRGPRRPKAVQLGEAVSSTREGVKPWAVEFGTETREEQPYIRPAQRHGASVATRELRKRMRVGTRKFARKSRTLFAGAR